MKIENTSQFLKIAKLMYSDVPFFDEIEMAVIERVFIGKEVSKVVSGMMTCIVIGGGESFPALAEIIEHGGLGYETR